MLGPTHTSLLMRYFNLGCLSLVKIFVPSLAYILTDLTLIYCIARWAPYILVISSVITPIKAL